MSNNSYNINLFESDEFKPKASASPFRPLADRLRPVRWEDFKGVEKLEKNLVSQLSSGAGVPPSMILWGTPGSGKTTLAHLIGNSYECNFFSFSAVLGGVKEVREIVKQAQCSRKLSILFVDEIHRFNKSQQDAFLPHIESGTIVLIGATTENPSFYLNSALLSRSRVVRLESLDTKSLEEIFVKASQEIGVQFDQGVTAKLLDLAGGDARRLINFIEGIKESGEGRLDFSKPLVSEDVDTIIKELGSSYYNRSGDEHFNMISAFIKSLRGSSPDGALFWCFRMINSGEDPRYLLRRMIIFASEDIGNADPRALTLAVSTFDAYEKLGLPEGRIPIAQCVTYLATAPKSNRSYKAMHKVLELIEQYPKVTVPLHLCNAPTKLLKEMGCGQEYQYPHDSDYGYIPNIEYLPQEVKANNFYQPINRGYEKAISERQGVFRELDKKEKK